MVRRAPRTVLFLGNELTTTLDLNTALKKLKLVSVLDAFISAQTFLMFVGGSFFSLLTAGPVVAVSLRKDLLVSDEPYGGHMSRPEGCHFPSSSSS